MGVSEYISWIKLSPKYWLAIALVATSLVVLPDVVTDTLGVTQFVDAFRMWIGFICILSYGLLLTHGLYASKDIIRKWWQQRRLLQLGRESLRTLSPPEKIMLADYVISQTKCMKQAYQDGIVQELQRANILYQASNLGNLMEGFAFNLQPWAWEELQSHPEILEPELSERRKEVQQRRRRGY